MYLGKMRATMVSRIFKDGTTFPASLEKDLTPVAGHGGPAPTRIVDTNDVTWTISKVNPSELLTTAS